MEIKDNTITIPLEFACIGEVMSNFDHEIVEGSEEKLKSGKFYGEYPAWDFFSAVWYDGESFVAEIKRYHVHVDTIVASTLEEIMEIASSRWGYD